MNKTAGGIDAIYFSVEDVARATAFYHAILDIRETTWENEHGAEWVLGDGNAFGVGRLPSGHRPSGTVLFAVDDVAVVAARVTELGGQLQGDMIELPVCTQQWCSDPDGNMLVLHRRRS